MSLTSHAGQFGFIPDGHIGFQGAISHPLLYNRSRKLSFRSEQRRRYVLNRANRFSADHCPIKTAWSAGRKGCAQLACLPWKTAGAVPAYSRSRVSPPISDTQYRKARKISRDFDHSSERIIICVVRGAGAYYCLLRRKFWGNLVSGQIDQKAVRSSIRKKTASP